MFSLSDKTLNHLCHAIHALWGGGWFEVLQEHGLADHAEWEEMMHFGQDEVDFFSLKNLKCHLDHAGSQGSENLRTLCNDLLRNREKYRSEAKDELRFSDSLAEFEVQLGRDRLIFDGFAIVSSDRTPLLGEVVERSRDSFLGTLRQFAGMEKAVMYLESAEKYLRELSDANKVECLTNLRLFFKCALEAVAKEQERRTQQPLPSHKEHEVRDYLRKVGFFTEEEWKGFNGIYGLLSRDHTAMGPRTLCV
jgi:hypothetical protein